MNMVGYLGTGYKRKLWSKVGSEVPIIFKNIKEATRWPQKTKENQNPNLRHGYKLCSKVGHTLSTICETWSLENTRKSRPKTRKWGQIILQSRLGRPQNLAKNCNTTEKRKTSHTVAPFGVPFWTPFWNTDFFSEERSFLRGPVSGSVLGFVLVPIL